MIYLKQVQLLNPEEVEDRQKISRNRNLSKLCRKKHALYPR